MPAWDWKVDMYGLQQPFTFKTPDGTVFDLTGYTVTLYVWSPAGVNLFSLLGVLHADPTTGICYFTPIITDFDTVGKFRFGFELTQAGVLVRAKHEIVEVTDKRR